VLDDARENQTELFAQPAEAGDKDLLAYYVSAVRDRLYAMMVSHRNSFWRGSFLTIKRF